MGQEELCETLNFSGSHEEEQMKMVGELIKHLRGPDKSSLINATCIPNLATAQNTAEDIQYIIGIPVSCTNLSTVHVVAHTLVLLQLEKSFWQSLRVTAPNTKFPEEFYTIHLRTANEFTGEQMYDLMKRYQHMTSEGKSLVEQHLAWHSQRLENWRGGSIKHRVLSVSFAFSAGLSLITDKEATRRFLAFLDEIRGSMHLEINWVLLTPLRIMRFLGCCHDYLSAWLHKFISSI